MISATVLHFRLDKADRFLVVLVTAASSSCMRTQFSCGTSDVLVTSFGYAIVNSIKMTKLFQDHLFQSKDGFIRFFVVVACLQHSKVISELAEECSKFVCAWERSTVAPAFMIPTSFWRSNTLSDLRIGFTIPLVVVCMSLGLVCQWVTNNLIIDACFSWKA